MSEEQTSGEAFTHLKGPFDPRKNRGNSPTLGRISNLVVQMMEAGKPVAASSIPKRRRRAMVKDANGLTLR